MTLAEVLMTLGGGSATLAEVLMTLGGSSAALASLAWAAGKSIDAWRRRRDRLDEKRLRAQEKVALAQIAADDRNEDRDERLIDRLDHRVQTLETMRDELHQMLVASREALLEQKAAVFEQKTLNERLSMHLDRCERDLADHKARIEVLESRVDNVPDSTRIEELEQRVPADITGKIRTEARREVRRALSDPHGIPAVREEVKRKPGDER